MFNNHIGLVFLFISASSFSADHRAHFFEGPSTERGFQCLGVMPEKHATDVNTSENKKINRSSACQRLRILVCPEGSTERTIGNRVLSIDVKAIKEEQKFRRSKHSLCDDQNKKSQLILLIRTLNAVNWASLIKIVKNIKVTGMSDFSFQQLQKYSEMDFLKIELKDHPYKAIIHGEGSVRILKNNNNVWEVFGSYLNVIKIKEEKSELNSFSQILLDEDSMEDMISEDYI